jgi:hypothetical protein
MVYYYVYIIIFLKNFLKNPIIIDCYNIKIHLRPWLIYNQFFMLQFLINECKRNAKNDAIDFKLLIIKENMLPFM